MVVLDFEDVAAETQALLSTPMTKGNYRKRLESYSKVFEYLAYAALAAWRHELGAFEDRIRRAVRVGAECLTAASSVTDPGRVQGEVFCLCVYHLRLLYYFSLLVDEPLPPGLCAMLPADDFFRSVRDARTRKEMFPIWLDVALVGVLRGTNDETRLDAILERSTDGGAYTRAFAAYAELSRQARSPGSDLRPALAVCQRLYEDRTSGEGLGFGGMIGGTSQWNEHVIDFRAAAILRVFDREDEFGRAPCLPRPPSGSLGSAAPKGRALSKPRKKRSRRKGSARD